MSNLNTLSAAAIVALYNGAVVDYAPEGFAEVKRFASKAKGIEALEALCADGHLAVNFDGDTATIVDAMQAADEGTGDEGTADEGTGDEGTADEGAADEGAADEGAADEGAADEGTGATLGDGKGKRREWGFALASDAWLKANPRHSADREAYRTARRKAARMARKAQREAKEAARDNA